VAELASRLGDDDYMRLDRQLQQTDRQLATRYPGNAGVRHLVHTGYAPATATTPAWPATGGAGGGHARRAQPVGARAGAASAPPAGPRRSRPIYLRRYYLRRVA